MALIGLFFYYLLCAAGVAGILFFISVIKNNYHDSSFEVNKRSAISGFFSFAIAYWSLITVIINSNLVKYILSYFDSFTLRVYIIAAIYSLVVIIFSYMMNTIFSGFINKKIAFSTAMIFNLLFLVGAPIFQIFKRAYSLTIFAL